MLAQLEFARTRLEERFDARPGELEIVLHSSAAQLDAAQPWVPLARRLTAPAARRYVVGWAGTRELHMLAPRLLAHRASNVEGSLEMLMLSPSALLARRYVADGPPAAAAAGVARTARALVALGVAGRGRRAVALRPDAARPPRRRAPAPRRRRRRASRPRAPTRCCSAARSSTCWRASRATGLRHARARPAPGRPDPRARDRVPALAAPHRERVAQPPGAARRAALVEERDGDPRREHREQRSDGERHRQRADPRRVAARPGAGAGRAGRRASRARPPRPTTATRMSRGPAARKSGTSKPPERRASDGMPSSSSRPWIISASAWLRAPGDAHQRALGVARAGPCARARRARTSAGRRIPGRARAAARSLAEALVGRVRRVAHRAHERAGHSVTSARPARPCCPRSTTAAGPARPLDADDQVQRARERGRVGVAEPGEVDVGLRRHRVRARVRVVDRAEVEPRLLDRLLSRYCSIGSIT